MGNLTFIILLSIVGVLFLVAELLIVPGVGVAGFCGLAAMGGACVYAFIKMGTAAGIIVTAVNLVIIIAGTVYALRAKTWQKLALETNIESTVGDASCEVSVGETGITETRLAPMGTARFAGKAVEVKAAKGMVDSGVEVEVVMIEDKKVIVKPVEK